MPKRKSTTLHRSNHPLVGRWISADPWKSEIEFIISRQRDRFTVRALDSDGEEAEVYDVKLSRGELSFATYWSSGQFTKCRLRAMAGNTLEEVFTYTDTITLKRKARTKTA